MRTDLWLDSFFRGATSLMPSPPPTSTRSGTPAVCSSTWPAPSSTCTAWISSTGTSSLRTCWWDWSGFRSTPSVLHWPTKGPFGQFQPHFTLLSQRLPSHPVCWFRSEAALICQLWILAAESLCLIHESRDELGHFYQRQENFLSSFYLV